MIRSTVGFDRSLTIDRELYTEPYKLVNRLIHESKMKFYANLLTNVYCSLALGKC